MTKYRKQLAALALAALLAPAGQACAGPLDQAFAPRAVPGVEYASLDIPVAKARKAQAPAPALPRAALEPAEAAPAEKGFWQRTKEFFGF